jgi:hypothetical protein
MAELTMAFPFIASKNRLAGGGWWKVAARLSDPQAREFFARIVSRMESLPVNDEFRQLAEMLCFVLQQEQQRSEEYAGFLATVRAEKAQIEKQLAELPAALALELQFTSEAQPIAQRFRFRSRRARRLEREIWFWPFELAAVMYMIGLVCGDQIERRRTAELMAAMSAKIEQLQSAVASLPGAITQFQSTHPRSPHH